jgi:hypothetical protein
MVYRLVLTLNGTLTEPSSTPSSTDPDLVLDDYTTNFEDLMYWRSGVHLNRNVEYSMYNLRASIKKLIQDGVQPKTRDAMHENQNWWFGHWPGRCGADGPEALLPDNQRKSILLFILMNTLHWFKTVCDTDDKAKQFSVFRVC